MNLERSVFEKCVKKVVLAGTAALALGQIACAKTEPTSAQAPTPSQGVTTEVVPSTATATPEPPPATATPRPPEPTARTAPQPPQPSRVEPSQFPNEAVFEGNLLPNKGGVAFYHRNGDMVIAVGVKQDCLDGNPEKMSVVLMTNPGEVNGLQLNRRWSSIGSINGRFMKPQNSLNGFLRLNQSDQRNCPPQEFTFFATNRGNGTEAFLMSYNKVLESINVLPVAPAAALADINSACPRCKLVLEGK